MLSPPRRSVRFCVPKLSKLLRSRSWRGFNLSTVNVHRKSILKMTWRLKRSKWWCNLHLQLCLNFIILRTKMTRQPFKLIVFKLFWQFIITKSRKIYFQNIITQPLFTYTIWNYIKIGDQNETFLVIFKYCATIFNSFGNLLH